MFPYLDYGITMWGSANKKYMNKITIKQKKALRIINNSTYNHHSEPLFKKSRILRIPDIHTFKMCKFMFDLRSGILPKPLCSMIVPNNAIHSHLTRNRNDAHVTSRRSARTSVAFKHKGPLLWYQLPTAIRYRNSAKSFSKALKKHIVNEYSDI